MAHCMWLHAQASEQVLLATGIVAVGCVILVCFGNHQSQLLSVDDMLRLYRRCACTYVINLLWSLAYVAVCMGKVIPETLCEMGYALLQPRVHLLSALPGCGLRRILWAVPEEQASGGVRGPSTCSNILQVHGP